MERESRDIPMEQETKEIPQQEGKSNFDILNGLYKEIASLKKDMIQGKYEKIPLSQKHFESNIGVLSLRLKNEPEFTQFLFSLNENLALFFSHIDKKDYNETLLSLGSMLADIKLIGRKLENSTSKQNIPEKKSQQKELSEIDWNNFVFELREHEVKILELVYLPNAEPIPFKKVYFQLARMNYSKRTARRKIEKLEKLGLITTVRTLIGIIQPVLPVANNIRTLIELYSRRKREVNFKPVENYQKICDLFRGESNG